MKTKLILLALILSGALQTVSAQAPDCASDFSIFVEYAKTKNYDSAYEPWLKTRNECPKYHKATYIYGEKILKSKIKKAPDAAAKKTYIDDLLKMYDEFDTNFPNNKRGNNVNKVMVLMSNKIGTDQEHYDMLHEAYPTGKKFFSAKAIYAYFSLYVDQYTKGDKGIALQDVFDRYDDLYEQLEKKSAALATKKDKLIVKQETTTLTKKEQRKFKAYETNIMAFAKVTTSMDGKISLLSSCDKLIPFYEKSFESKKSNAVWLERASQRLEVKDCTKDPLFNKIAEALHNLNPTAKSAYNLGIVARNGGKTTKAVEFFNQAADLQTDNTKKAKIYYQIATIYKKSNKSKARNYARKALKVKPSYGRSYLLMADLYANSLSTCGKNPFEKRAINWLAAEMAEKAGRVDGSLKSTATKAAKSYRQRAPSKSDIFNSGMQGKTITFDCWVGASVKVPSL